MPSVSRMNVSMPAVIRGLVKQGAISTAALERDSVDASAWVIRAICEKLVREWAVLEFPEPIPDEVRALAASAHGFGERSGPEPGPSFRVRGSAVAAVA